MRFRDGYRREVERDYAGKGYYTGKQDVQKEGLSSRLVDSNLHAVSSSSSVPCACSASYAGFSDGYPFLVVSEASLEDLNKRLSQPIPMNRFRPK